ncbi:hypothetical protein [Jiangella alkaliphila]|uniref:Uncharacterized protein n=1 Tax=Jiangella alkaliphila TaxID=419479 RepID=A0A1H2H3K6_9ACTN|nr:hypothetical protein [Jiangella alkaliphila]SDU26413.1 hypothetical protein SAMN04488563_0823 [Jiangella alkaliphila]
MADMTAKAPSDLWRAADWLAGRHPWVRQLVERITGPLILREDWLDVVTRAVNESDADGVAWVEYERRHPAPSDEVAFYRWQDAGPQSTPIAHAFGVMSSGEKNLVRLVATLGGRVAWSPMDVSFDQRGAAVLADWLAIVHAQLPAWVYPVASDDALVIQLAAVSDAINGEVAAVSR